LFREELCSINCRLLVFPSTPASTLGLAAASITQSAGGSELMSLALRISRWRKSELAVALFRLSTLVRGYILTEDSDELCFPFETSGPECI
jgi:hypothetical protein